MSCPYCNGEDHLWSCYWCGRQCADQLRAELATAQKEAKRCADGWDALHAASRADLATVKAERNGACEGKGNLWAQLEAARAAHAETRKELELQTELKYIALRGEQAACAELATVTAERDQAREGWKTTSALAVETQDALDAERAAHAETRKALEEYKTRALRGESRLDEISQALGAHSDERDMRALESTRAELAKAESRVKELERENTELQTFRTVFSKDRLRG